MKNGHLGIGDSFGVVSLAFATRDVPFPADRSELAERMDRKKIMWSRNQVIDLGEVLDRSERESFDSFADLISEISHYEDSRTAKITSFV